MPDAKITELERIRVLPPNVRVWIPIVVDGVTYRISKEDLLS